MSAFVCKLEETHFDNGLGRIGNGEENKIKKQNVKLVMRQDEKSKLGLTGGRAAKKVVHDGYGMALSLGTQSRMTPMTH